jgi:hypothetical protein
MPIDVARRAVVVCTSRRGADRIGRRDLAHLRYLLTYLIKPTCSVDCPGSGHQDLDVFAHLEPSARIDPRNFATSHAIGLALFLAMVTVGTPSVGGNLGYAAECRI